MTRFAFVTVVAVAASATVCAGEPAYTIADVKKAWKVRQESQKSFRIEWVETTSVKAGAYDSAATRDTPGPHPPKDSELKSVCSLAADGEKVAGTTEGQTYDVPGKNWKPYLSAGYFDGKTALQLLPPERAGWGRAEFRSGNDRLDAGTATLQQTAAWQFYRPLGGGVLINFDTYKPQLSGRTEKIRGATCVELVVKNIPPGSTRTVWCDPARGYLPLREQHRNAFADYDREWEYRKDEKRGWVLSKWEHTSLRRGGAVVSVTKAEVRKLEFDVKFPPNAFAPNPPPASHVMVYADRAPKEEYLVRPDGSKRPLAAAERGKSLDELAKTNADGTPYVPKKK